MCNLLHVLPSGKQPHNYGKTQHFQWENPLFQWWFSIAHCWHNQRVLPVCAWPWCVMVIWKSSWPSSQVFGSHRRKRRQAAVLMTKCLSGISTEHLLHLSSTKARWIQDRWIRPLDLEDSRDFAGWCCVLAGPANIGKTQVFSLKKTGTWRVWTCLNSKMHHKDL